MISRPPNNPSMRAPRNSPRPLPARGALIRAAPPGLVSARDVPGSAAPAWDSWLPSLEEMASRNRRAVRRAAIGQGVRIVLVEIWLTSFIGTVVAAHSQLREQALTTITHPWMWWRVAEAFPVLAGGTVLILMSLWAVFIEAVFVLRGPDCDADAFRRYLDGNQQSASRHPLRRFKRGHSR